MVPLLRQRAPALPSHTHAWFSLGSLGLLFVRRPAPLDISKRSRADVGPGRFAPASRWHVKGGTHDIVPPDFAEILSSDFILRQLLDSGIEL